MLPEDLTLTVINRDVIEAMKILEISKVKNEKKTRGTKN